MSIVSTQHGRYQVNEYIIDIDQGMRDRALAFATKIKLSGNQYSRLLPEDLREETSDNIVRILKLEIQRTYVGKLGELAFLSLLREKGIECETAEMFTIYEGQENTDSFDFVSNDGILIDIKTGFRSNHSRLLINMEQFANHPKDYYVGVKLNGQDDTEDDKLILWDSVQTATIKGYAEKNYLNNRAERDFGEGLAKYIEYDKLLGIDRLLRMF